MTDTRLLEKLISDSGLKKNAIAMKMHLTPFGLQKKIDNLTEFKASEIKTLCDILGIRSLTMRERLFFTQKDDFKSSTQEAV